MADHTRSPKPHGKNDTMSKPYEMEKPSVITLVQVIMWIQVALLAIAVCSLGALMDQAANAGLSDALGILLVVYVLYAILLVVLVLNIGNGRKWARITTIVLECLAIAGLLLNSGAQEAWAVVIGIIVAAILLGSLASRDAAEWCSR